MFLTQASSEKEILAQYPVVKIAVQVIVAGVILSFFFCNAFRFPLAYPPLAFYVMVPFLKLGVSAFTYLRFMPAVFSVLSLVPLFLFVEDLLKSRAAALRQDALQLSSHIRDHTASDITRKARRRLSELLENLPGCEQLGALNRTFSGGLNAYLNNRMGNT